ncbi:facilitated trehalose transporter Tret1-like isoform X1 [Aricia agestis]|uniref:facilitated trehalose transporter Tret1-like isoform X1 n=1 Tax=Aricia agestis TaxID=91739 RepID=UPI001C207D43|nr:facilitated trehalose transporter Tret1-like isoform X1 [Aricia agestis]
MSVYRQAISSIIVCCQMLSLSMLYVWPSSTIMAFASKDTPLDRPMTDMELNFFGSLFPIMSFVATPLPAYLIDVFGRKKSCLLLAFPQVIAWTLISFCNKVEIILTAACIGGIAGCQLVIVPLYIVEISQENIRGTLTAGTTVLCCVGNALSYGLGGLLTFRVMNYVSLTIVTVAFILLTFVKESPTFLMKKNREKEAAKSIAYYRSANVNDKDVINEINILRNFLNSTLDDSPEEEKLKADSITKKKISTLQFIRKSRSTRRGLFLILSILFLTTIQGMPIVLVYSKPIFHEAMPSISASTISILIAMVNLVSGLFSAYMLDVVGRRVIFMYSAVVSCISSIALGTQMVFHFAPSWTIVVYMMVYCISYTIGSGTVPFVLMAELFLPEVKGILTVVALEWLWTCTFFTLFLFNPIVKLLGVAILYYFFAFASLATFVFSYFYLIETKGLPVNVIQTLLIKK